MSKQLNNLLKAAARKHALANGIPTAGWSDQDFLEYIEKHGITERDNLKTNNQKSATELLQELEDKDQRDLGEAKTETKPTEKPKHGKIEEAIEELVKATGAGLDEDRVIQLINEHSKAPVLHSVEIKQQDKPTITREGVHKDYDTVLGHIAAGVNIAAVGPAGSGKSTMFRQIAEDLGLDYYIVSKPQQEHKIMGYEDGHGKYHPTPFRFAFENGGLVVIEEFDGSNAKALLSANNAIENDWADFPDGMVKKHDKFVCVMAGNTYGTGASRQYVGRTQIDDATLDRFAFLDIGYDEALERAVALSWNPDADRWISTVQAFRARVEAAGIRHIVSPRASINGAKLLKQGLSWDVITKSVLHKGLSQDQIAQIGG